ncbi:MAG: tRNA pseudouridine(38-40) synthase TruA [bacterium]|nr:tRNA pseudouridine(38-40) synthase TruA [bacterium]
MVRCLTVAYRGTRYSGWQRQPNGVTIQQRLEEALEAVLGERVRVIGAGRTDAGVHARGQVAHIGRYPGGPDRSVGSDLPDAAFVHGTNRHLPPDIRILEARRMAEGFHARNSAISKVYTYRMVPTRVLSPLDSVFAAQVDPRIRVEPMREALAGLVGRHDFTAFALAGGAHKDPHRRIMRAALRESDGGDLIFEVEGDGFLRGMVRSLVGTLLEVGRARRSPTEFLKLLAGAPRSAAGPTAPPQGLVLEKVRYPSTPAE